MNLKLLSKIGFVRKEIFKIFKASFFFISDAYRRMKTNYFLWNPKVFLKLIFQLKILKEKCIAFLVRILE